MSGLFQKCLLEARQAYLCRWRMICVTTKRIPNYLVAVLLKSICYQGPSLLARKASYMDPEPLDYPDASNKIAQLMRLTAN